MAMVMRLGECVAEARLNPRPGIIKALIEAEVDGQPLSDEGIIGTTFLVIGGGFDTTTSLTSSAWYWLSDHPDERARLLADPGLLDTATEEFLRFFSPSQGDVPRSAPVWSR